MIINLTDWSFKFNPNSKTIRALNNINLDLMYSVFGKVRNEKLYEQFVK